MEFYTFNKLYLNPSLRGGGDNVSRFFLTLPLGAVHIITSATRGGSANFRFFLTKGGGRVSNELIFIFWVFVVGNIWYHFHIINGYLIKKKVYKTPSELTCICLFRYVHPFVIHMLQSCSLQHPTTKDHTKKS